MFWILKRSGWTNGAANFFNSLNNNSSNGNNSTGGNKKAGYNKLACCDETSVSADVKNGNIKNCLTAPLQPPADGDSSDSSSASDFELEEDDFSDDSDHDESLTCNVCDRSYSSPRQLSQHQQKKRHFGCSSCAGLFPSLMALEHHKEEFEHWSADESMLAPHSHSEDSSEETSEEMERLL